MAFYDSGVTYDSGILYDEPMPTTQTKMIQLKLELQEKSDAELKEFSLTHINKMNGNAAFPTPVPSTVAFQAIHDAFSAGLTGFDAAQAAAVQATITKDATRANLEIALTQRVKNIEGTPNLTAAQAASTGFALRASATPVGDMPKPVNLSVTGGDLSGENDLQWSPVKGRNTYLGEVAASPTGPWTQFYVGKKSSATATGLTPGALNYFRIRAVGTNGPGPWSDIGEGRAS